jgi:hypothetical protein
LEIKPAYELSTSTVNAKITNLEQGGVTKKEKEEYSSLITVRDRRNSKPEKPVTPQPIVDNTTPTRQEKFNSSILNTRADNLTRFANTSADVVQADIANNTATSFDQGNGIF